MIKKIIGVLIIIAGIGLGVYLGLWIMFIGGILAIAHSIDAHTFTATLIAINVIKILLASFVGVLPGYIGIVLGAVLIND